MSLVECSRRMQVGYATYPEGVNYAFNQGPNVFKKCAKAGSYIVDIILCCSHFGVCVVYIVFVSANIKQLFDYHWTVLDLRAYIAIIGLLLIPFFMIRQLKYLVPTNLLATVLIYLGFIMMMYFVFSDLPSISDRSIFFGEIEKLPLFFGIALFSITSVGVMLAIESQMEKPQHYIGWFGVLDKAIVLVLISYIFVAIMGYWRYGEEIQDSLSLNIPSDEVVSQVAKAFIAIDIFLTYPLSGYVVIDIIMNHCWNKNKELKHPVLKELVIRVAYVLCTTITGLIFPNLGPLLSLVGAFTISLLNLVFPPMIDICLYYPPEYNYGKLKWKLVRDILLIVIGILILVNGTSFAIMEMINKWGFESETTTEEPTTEASTMADNTTAAAMKTTAVAGEGAAIRFF
ncbi:glutamate transporter polyphemus-like isoform X2 [Drosophila ficusphila]|nr:glutamate transporter polyphemus-like isoform X2 [Drosophila ficusphila]